MSKIVIIGSTGSGKTCYFYGMLSEMMIGCHGFSLSPSRKYISVVQEEIRRLRNNSLPLEERFPEPSFQINNYEMDLLYNLGKMETFNWVDYPGELAQESTEEFVNLLEGATCLLLCVDGQAIQGSNTEEDIEDIIDSIYNYKGGLEICNALSQAEKKYENGFPPVCVMVTKYDEVSEELRNQEVLYRIIKASFPVLFNEGNNGNGKDRMVTICPVTLGKYINIGGTLSPKNVEKPICFANYLKFKNLIDADEYKRKIGIKPKALTEEQQAINNLLKNGKEDLDALRGMIETLPLYINGEKSDWPD